MDDTELVNRVGELRDFQGRKVLGLRDAIVRAQNCEKDLAEALEVIDELCYLAATRLPLGDIGAGYDKGLDLLNKHNYRGPNEQ
jgi:hypothetical protein